MRRNILSPKNPYYLPKNMYLTAVRYCLQYPELKKQLIEMYASAGVKAVGYSGMPHGFEVGRPTEETAIKIAELSRKITLIEDTVRDVTQELYKWMIVGVTEDVNYYYMRTVKRIPCGERKYHVLRHRIYYEISKKI